MKIEKLKKWVVENRIRATLLAVLTLFSVAFFFVLSTDTDEFLIILDDFIPLGGPSISTPIETNWDFNSSKWNLTFEDEFSGKGKPDRKKWEVQEYNRKNNDNGPDGYWLKDQVYQNGEGQLVIDLSRIKNKNKDGDEYDYASGMVRSKNKFEQAYGKYEIKCKLPKEQGWWVAFWLMTDDYVGESLGGTDGAEIDIFEGFGWKDTVYHTVHWDGYGDNHRSTYNLTEMTNRDDYHTYTLIWTPTEYQYYVDGELAWVTKGGGVSRVPEYLKITGEVSTKGWFPTDSWAQNPELVKSGQLVKLDEFVIDYVKVYEYDE